jgi:hypothetical protein
MHSIRKGLQNMVLLAYIAAWASALPRTFVCGEVIASDRIQLAHGWIAKAHIQSINLLAHKVSCAEAIAFQAIVVLADGVAPMILADRIAYFSQLALEAQRAADRGDSRGVFAVVKKLANSQKRPPPAVILEDGTVSKCREEMLERIQRHFCSVSRGAVVQDLEFLKTLPSHVAEGCFDVSPERFFSANMKLSINRGLGLDGIGAALLRAGGFAMAVQQSRLAEEVVKQEVFSVHDKGGRLA